MWLVIFYLSVVEQWHCASAAMDTLDSIVRIISSKLHHQFKITVILFLWRILDLTLSSQYYLDYRRNAHGVQTDEYRRTRTMHCDIMVVRNR